MRTTIKGKLQPGGKEGQTGLLPSGGGDHACGDAALPSGDGELLLSLYREERPFLLRVIKNNPYCLAGMEEDILHEAVERLLEKVGKDHKGWESRAHCRNSLLVTAKNLAIDHSRREARRSRLFLYQAELVRHASGEREEGEPFLDYEGLVARSGSDNGPEDLLLRSEDYSRVRVMLESLEEEEKHLLFMREELGLPWEKVAAVVGTSPETLRVRYARLKARLRRAFRDGVGS